MEIKTFEQKILEFQNSIDTIKKDSQNPHFKNTYASLGQILSEVKPILNALKLVLIQPIKNNEAVTTIFDVENKESFLSSMIPLPNGLTPQQLGSAITYYRRYSLTSLLALEIDDDDDGQNASESKPAETEKQWLNKFTDKSKIKTTETWDAVCDSLKKGYTILQVESKYKLSKELKAELIQIQNNG